VRPSAKTVVFDLDGTLTDSEAGIVASYRHALDSWGIKADTQAIRPWIGPPLRDGFLALGVPRAELDEAIGRYRDFFSTEGILENRLYSGITPMLTSLSEAGVVLALATSKLDEYARSILHDLSIAHFFVVVAGSTRDGTRLDKHQILEHALEALGGADPSTVVMVGDREHDVRAALECGVRPIGVTWGYGTVTELRLAGADCVVGSPDELTSLLLKSSWSSRPSATGS